ncbi:MAG: BT_3928 family protein [Eudoraea sp.]
MKLIVGFSRVFVGVLFIISGFIKLNDPLGFSFKLEEYFSQGVLDIPFLIPFALSISLFVVIFEVLLGVFLLIGYQRKFTLWSLLLMIVFFTFLTFYSAYFNKVTDCGCFGDAVKLTPWESFTKDIILLVFIVILVLGKEFIRPLFYPRTMKGIAITSLIVCIIYGYYVLNHLPQIDFRPYKIGANITEGMSYPEDAPKAVFEYAWKFNINGKEEVIITQGDYPQVEGEFVGVETTEIQKGYEPPIHDFTIEQEGVDYTEVLMQEDKLMLVIAYDMAKSEYEAFSEVQKISEIAMNKGYKVIGMSASNEEWTGKIKSEYHLNFPFYFTDETTLKTIVRSNPGVLLLEKGTIKQKVHYNDLADLKID